jgi:hypothetical protein
MWLALIRAEGVNFTLVMCFYGASGKPGDIPQYVALHWYKELYQCIRGIKMDTNNSETTQGAVVPADLLQQKPYVDVIPT